MKKTLTQQGAFRKERKALQRAIANGLTEKDIVMEMVKRMDNPDSAITLNQASAAVMYLTALCNKETPITDCCKCYIATIARCYRTTCITDKIFNTTKAKAVFSALALFPHIKKFHFCHILLFMLTAQSED